MPSLPSRFFLRARVLACLFTAALAGAIDGRAQTTMVHTLEAFHSPAAVLALDDGETLLVANTGRGDYGLVMGRGSISRVKLGDDGKLAVETLRFIEKLNGPLGLTRLATASDTLPAGTLVVTVGGSWMVDLAGDPLPDDASRGTGLVFFDPQTAEARGQILLGAGSPAAKALGHPVTDPSGIASDSAGNLYLIDVDVAMTRSSRRREAHAGVIKIHRAALEPMLRGEEPPAGSLQYASEPSIPTALGYSNEEDALYWVTFGGEMRRLDRGDFSGQSRVITVNKEYGTAAALGFTPSGTLVAAMADGTLTQLRGRRARLLRFPNEMRFLSPGQPALVREGDERLLLILPEQDGGGVGPWRQRVNVIALPKDL